MKNSIKTFFIKGFPVQIHWTFLLLFAWVLITQVISREPVNTALLTISELLLVFVCVFLHEVGHALAARYYKISIRKIQLLPVGGLTYFSRQAANPRQETVISLAGPLVNICIAIITLPFLPAGTAFWKLGMILRDWHASNVFHFIYTINIALAIINLVPALPMDGGKIIKGMLGIFLSPNMAFRTTLIITRICSFLITLAGLFTGNLLLILFGSFLLFLSTIERDNYIISFLLKDENVADVVSQDFKKIDVQNSQEEILQIISSCNDRYFVLTDHENVVGILDKEIILFSFLSSRKAVSLKNMIIPDINPIPLDNKLTDIWNQLPSKADIFLPVTSPNKKVIGVISRDNIISRLLNQAMIAHREPFAMAFIIPLLLSLLTIQQKPSIDTAGYYNHAMRILHDTPSVTWKYNPTPPLQGAILPYKRIVAFYGNLYAANMGILGELPPEKMKAQLLSESRKWAAADPLFPVQPALHYIAVTAQPKPGKDKKYRLRMPAAQIDSIISMARQIHAIIFLDVQVGHSTLQEELVPLEKYLQLPDVHLGIDPEYSMKNNAVPCSEIGTFDASDINFACSFLQDLVIKYHLPPKILIVHRFTQSMVTNYRNIKICDQVQIVMNMDGFGFPAKKKDSYKYFVAKEPVQYTGFKLFYKNDITPVRKTIMQPDEILRLYPIPVYIQYQ